MAPTLRTIRSHSGHIGGKSRKKGAPHCAPQEEDPIRVWAETRKFIQKIAYRLVLGPSETFLALWSLFWFSGFWLVCLPLSLEFLNLSLLFFIEIPPKIVCRDERRLSGKAETGRRKLQKSKGLRSVGARNTAGRGRRRRLCGRLDDGFCGDCRSSLIRRSYPSPPRHTLYQKMGQEGGYPR